FLIDHLPPACHLVITTRIDPSLPLARWRVRNQLAEIRAADLRFTPDEAATFLNEVMGLNLPAEDIAALETRTEGWIAGLQLAALSMQGRNDIADFLKAFTGSHAYIIDYLAEEALHRQPDNVQTFLFQTSTLERMSGPLCDAVTGRDDSQAVLEKLQQNNLFIVALDDRRDWYRYHHLFAEVLRQGLHRSFTAEAVADLHRRASSWHQQAGLIGAAVHHALAAQAFDQAATLVEQVASAMIQHSQLVRLLGWLAILPAAEVQTRPLLGLYSAWGLFLTGQVRPAIAHLEAVETLLEADETKQTPEVQGHVAAMRAYLVRETGDLAATINLSRQALTHLPEQDSLLRAMVALNLAIAHYLQGDFEPASDLLNQTIATGQTAERMANTLSAIYLLTQLVRGQGNLRQALQLCQEGLALVVRYGWENFPAIGFLYVAFGDLLRERNELSLAGEYLKKGIALGQAGGHPHILISGHVWLAWLRQIEGNVTDSQEAIQAALQLIQQYEVSRFWPIPPAACTQVRLWLAQGNLAAASRWGQTNGLNQVDTPLPYLYEADYLTLARLWIAQGDLEAAESLLLRLHRAAAAAGRSGSLIEILILQAITFSAQKRREEALSALEQALRRAEPEGFVRIFLDEGVPVTELLRQAVAQGVHAAYALQLLNVLEEAALASQPLIEPLSERELEVLRRVAAGFSNHEIAQDLVIAVGTVKKHLNTIYGKLEARSRTQAIAKARDLNLL
ncbi:MAG: hypothetical protein KDE59_29995, partial [Anaerolineales bacterium]|nr:hypothetical protein [Anaerolineales bacterium]